MTLALHLSVQPLEPTVQKRLFPRLALAPFSKGAVLFHGSILPSLVLLSSEPQNQAEPPASLPFQRVLDTLISLPFHMNLRIILSAFASRPLCHLSIPRWIYSSITILYHLSPIKRSFSIWGESVSYNIEPPDAGIPVHLATLDLMH